MAFEYFLQRAKNFVKNPKSEWQAIQDEDLPRYTLIFQWAMPPILLGTIISLLFEVWNFNDLGLKFVLRSPSRYFLTYVVSLFVSYFIINKLCDYFGSNPHSDRAFTLVVYCSLPMFFASAVSQIHFMLWPLHYLGGLAVVMFWHGLPVLLDTQNEKRLSFTIVSTALVLLLPVIIRRFVFSLIGL